MKLKIALIFGLLMTAITASYTTAEEPSLVVLIHGLARSTSSMKVMTLALESKDYKVCNIEYPSRKFPIATLAQEYVLPEIKKCTDKNSSPVHVVTHSLGGILLRHIEKNSGAIDFARVVMLGPPNQGSEIVDKLGGLWPFQWLNGPAGKELGTHADDLPLALGSTQLDVGIIAGSNTINPILSLLIPGDDDGKVAIEHTKLLGMRDFIVLPASHPFLMKDKGVIEQTLHYLESGHFKHSTE